MDLLVPGRHSASDQLRVLAMLARAGANGFGAPQRALLEAVERVVFETGLEIETLEPIAPDELALRVEGPAHAQQLIRLLVVMSLVDGPPSREQMVLLSRFSTALGIDEPAVEVIGHLANGNRLRFRLAFMRRSHARHYISNTRRMGGIRSVVQALLGFRGLVLDAKLAARFHALEALPEDTLGHRFLRHCRKEGLPLPGEKGGFPIGGVYHDFTHVLTGNDTSPEGEMRNAAFQAGYTRGEHDFFTWLISIVLHTTGVNLIPFPVECVPGRIAEGTLAVDVLRELKRATALKMDLGDGWNFWEYVDLPIDVARERLGIGPPVGRSNAPQLGSTL